MLRDSIDYINAVVEAKLRNPLLYKHQHQLPHHLHIDLDLLL